MEIERDDIPQDDSTLGLFDMELEVAVEETMNEGEEVGFKCDYKMLFLLL